MRTKAGVAVCLIVIVVLASACALVGMNRYTKDERARIYANELVNDGIKLQEAFAVKWNSVRPEDAEKLVPCGKAINEVRPMIIDTANLAIAVSLATEDESIWARFSETYERAKASLLKAQELCK